MGHPRCRQLTKVGQVNAPVCHLALRTPLRLIALCIALSGLSFTAACGERGSGTPDASVQGEPDAGQTSSDGGDGGESGTDAGTEPLFGDPFTLTPFDKVRINSHSDQPNFQQADAPFDWGNISKASVKLVVDLDTTCYPFSKWQQDPPPEGHKWPPLCDAFDRTFTFTINPAATPEDPPGFEVVRAITPFGGPLHLEIDLTDLANGLPGAHTLRTRIETWSDGAGQVSGSNGGWFVTARIEVTPGRPPASVAAVIPLYQGNQTESGEGGRISFDIPEGTVETRLEYRVTGHGGPNSGGDSACIGPFDEFCRRQHELLVDDVRVDNFEAWRDDCAQLCTVVSSPGPFGGSIQYCQENPTGAQQSVRAPRANWCPGSLTPPRVVYPDALAQAGGHTFSWRINKIGAGGVWNVSAWAIAYGVRK